MRRRPRRRWVLLVAVLPPVALLAVVGAQAELARRAPMLEDAPLELGGPVGEAERPPLKVLWLGDSTAAGIGASTAARALPTLVAEGLGRPVELTVAARSGARVAGVVDRQLPMVAALDPDVVFVSVGANDVTHLTTTADFERRYRRLIQGLPGAAEVVLLGVPDMGAVPRLAQPLRAITGWRGRSLDQVVRRAAEEAGSVYVDIAGETGPVFRSDPERYFAADGYHPSDEGYRRWADAVLASAPLGSLSRTPY